MFRTMHNSISTHPTSSDYLLALGFASFTSSAALRLCDAMLPALAQEFGASLGYVSWTTSAYALAYGLLQLLYGTLGDRHGKWRVVTLATLGCTVGSVLAAGASTLPMLIFARALTGATAAAIIPLSMALIGDRVPEARRQVVLARYLTATISGMIVGQWASGTFADTIGWRWAFAVWAVLFGLVGSFMLVRGRAEWRAVPTGQRTAFVSSIVRVLGERRARGVLAITIAHSALAFGAITFVPAFLHHEFGLSLRAAAGVVVSYGVGGLVYSWCAGGVVGRLGGPRLMRIGGILLALSYIGLLAAPHWAWALLACFVAGLGYYAMQNLLNMEATVMYPSLRGTALSLFAAALFAGIALGVSVAAVVIGHAGYRAVFGAAAIGVLIVSTLYGRTLAKREAAAASVQHG